MGRVLDGLDHPFVFVLAVAMCVWGLSGVATYAFKRAGWSGPTSLVQHG